MGQGPVGVVGCSAGAYRVGRPIADAPPLKPEVFASSSPLAEAPLAGGLGTVENRAGSAHFQRPAAAIATGGHQLDVQALAERFG